MVATHRRIAALVGAPLVLVGTLLGATPSRAADVFVQVTPSTIEAGFMIGIKASCTANSTAATVESPAFGSVTAQPQAGFLTATALVPENTRADTFRVRLSCPSGRSASTQLIVIAASRPGPGPATGFGGSADDQDPADLLVLGGIATTVAGAVLGLYALRRRAAPLTARPTPDRTRS